MSQVHKEESLYDKKDATDVTVEGVPDSVNEYQVDPAVEKRLLRKLDMRIVPISFVMYFFSALDRSNLSNAKTDGMTTDLAFVGNQYSTLITVFTVFFAVFCVPGAMLTSIVPGGPKVTLPAMMVLWGFMAAVGAAATNFGEMAAIRILLGIFEAGFAPSLILWLTFFYTRGELGKRICAFYCCLALSGAFSGLLSYGVFQIVTDKLHGWQILFIIEGALTVLVALVCGYFMPPRPEHCTFLTDEEKAVARLRTLRDSTAVINAKYSHAAFFASLREPTFYAYALIAFSYGVGSATASNFLPQIVAKLGYSVVKTNLYTVAPNIFSAVCVIVTACSSDRMRERSFHLISALCMTFTGCIILVARPGIGVSYFATFLIAGGAFSPSVIFHTWHNCNAVSENGRAFRTGALTFAANIAGIVSANIFFEASAPAYIPALGVTAGFEALAIITILALRTYFALDNRRRNKAQGVKWTSADIPTSALAEGPKNPSYRWFC